MPADLSVRSHLSVRVNDPDLVRPAMPTLRENGVVAASEALSQVSLLPIAFENAAMLLAFSLCFKLPLPLNLRFEATVHASLERACTCADGGAGGWSVCAAASRKQELAAPAVPKHLRSGSQSEQQPCVARCSQAQRQWLTEGVYPRPFAPPHLQFEGPLPSLNPNRARIQKPLRHSLSCWLQHQSRGAQ